MTTSRPDGGTRSATYAGRYFAINTDASKLTSANLPWRQRSLAYQQAFPEYRELILAIVRAPTAELVSGARNSLLDELLRDLASRTRSTGTPTRRATVSLNATVRIARPRFVYPRGKSRSDPTRARCQNRRAGWKRGSHNRGGRDRACPVQPRCCDCPEASHRPCVADCEAAAKCGSHGESPEAELADRRAGRLRRWTKRRRDFGRVTRRCAGGISREQAIKRFGLFQRGTSLA